MQPFVAVETASFRKIFEDIPSVDPPFQSATTYKRYVEKEFEELAETYAWTSKNHLSILAIIGHWLTTNFEYKERVLEFAEIQGEHIENMLLELNLDCNETLCYTLYENLSKRFELEFDDIENLHTPLRFRGLDSFEFLSALKTGDIEDGKRIPELSALARLRVLVIWLARSPLHANLAERYIEYDVETRWNSSKRQIFEYLKTYPILPQFSIQDWTRLQQIHKALQRFDEFTRLVDRERDFQDFDPDVAFAAKSAIDKYQKYYSFMDDSNTYYAAAILDPRVKTRLLEHELPKSDARILIQGLREELHEQYQYSSPEPALPAISPTLLEPQSLESRMFSKLQPQAPPVFVSDIDRYFDTPAIPLPHVLAKGHDNWLLSWWNGHKEEYPCMAQVARHYLPIPGSEVSVERLFSGGRDLLGLRRHRMNAETMRILMLLRDYYLSCT
ncbi:ribonuclease H-like domain-containing protein [Xylogone sp. PMI_703]|nr:ribonuclease H-like domain-containing protein [Xylogone sp. PMI_703]